MKKTSILLVLALCTIFAMAQNGRIDLRNTSRAEITMSDFTTLRAVFSIGSIESMEVSTEKGVFSEIAIEGAYAAGEIGSPELPAIHQLLAVPFGATPQVSVLNFTAKDYNLSDFGINTILPHQPSVRKDQKPEEIEFVYNSEAYQTRGLASAPEATIEVQGVMRGIRIGSLVINPVSYNPVSNTLRVFNNIEVEISFEGADRAETERMLVNTYSPYFDIVYKQMFNYREILDVYTDHPDLMAYPVHMIVVTPENYVSTLQPWLNWKIQKGFDVNVVTTAQAGSTYTAIRSYVQNLYNTGVSQGATPTFLILVGDVAQVPNTTGSSTQKVTDLYYGSVDSDYFPDMFYSRISAENTSQLTAILNKILEYEQYTMPDPSYLNNATFVAGWDSYWTSMVGAPTVNYATANYYNTAHGFTNVYTHVNQSQYSGCYNSLNTGIGFVNYTAHGDNQEWYQPHFGNSNVNALTNTDKYFLAMGNCCLSGNFGYGQPCFGEAMIRAENKAAYSYIGSCPNTYWYEDYYFAVGATHTVGSTPNINNTATGVYDGIWMDDTYNTISSMTFLGNIAVCYAYAGSYSNSASSGCSTTYYWQAYHVLGDGSIMPYRIQPTANTVSHTATFPANTTVYSVSAEAGSYVGISQENVLLGAALVPASGVVDVPVTPVTAGEVRIVVTKPQRQPYVVDIPVENGGVISYMINVSADPVEGGIVSGGGAHQENSSCTVIATPNEGYQFDNWTENGAVVSDQSSYTFVVENTRNLVAHFSLLPPQQFTITASADPVEGGTITGAGTYQEGQNCVLIATPATGFEFVSWTKNGSEVSYNTTYHFVVTESASLVAHFRVQSFAINIEANPAEGGTIAGGGTYDYNQTCVIEATANEGYDFISWTEGDEVVTTDPSFSFNVTEEHSFVANFELKSFEIIVTINYEEGGAVTGGGTYNYGEEAVLTVETEDEYNFLYWMEDETIVSEDNPYTFVVTGERFIKAILQNSVGVSEQESKMVVYPNPVNDKLTIEAKETINSLEIYNVTGALVYSQRDCGNKTEIQMGNLPAGTYIVRLTTDNAVAVRRFVKE